MSASWRVLWGDRLSGVSAPVAVSSAERRALSVAGISGEAAAVASSAGVAAAS